MRGHYRGDGGISFSVTGIARQSLEDQTLTAAQPDVEFSVPIVVFRGHPDALVAKEIGAEA